MSVLNTSPSWNVGRASGRCAACGTDLPPNTPCWAALCDGTLRTRSVSEGQTDAPSAPEPTSKQDPKSKAAPSPFLRVDFCEACWAQGRRPEQLPPEATGHSDVQMFSYWRTTVPAQEQKKKLLVDDAVLVDVFARMDGKNEPQEVRFRFVLALILMRKRLLKYEGSETAAANPATLDAKPPETWRMLPKATEGWGEPVFVVNPHLTADQIAEVSQQLSAILAEEI